jgi:hypothetical protein
MHEAVLLIDTKRDGAVAWIAGLFRRRTLRRWRYPRQLGQALLADDTLDFNFHWALRRKNSRSSMAQINSGALG